MNPEFLAWLQGRIASMQLARDNEYDESEWRLFDSYFKALLDVHEKYKELYPARPEQAVQGFKVGDRVKMVNIIDEEIYGEVEGVLHSVRWDGSSWASRMLYLADSLELAKPESADHETP